MLSSLDNELPDWDKLCANVTDNEDLIDSKFLLEKTAVVMEIKGDITMHSNIEKRRNGRTHENVSLAGNLGVSLCFTSCVAQD